MDKETIVLVVGAIITALSLANEKIRNAILGRATFKKETTDATDDTIERLQNRVNSLSDEFVRLNESNIATQKENFKLKSSIIAKCKNNCFE